jgi:hypothetical protein
VLVSRFSDEYEEDAWYANAGALWQANLRRALVGRRGQRALRELREALLALPEKRLIAGALCTVGARTRPEPDYGEFGLKWYRKGLEETLDTEGEGVCAIGAYLWHRKVKSGVDPERAFEELPMLLGSEGGGDYETAQAGADAGLTFTLAWGLAYRNDALLEAATPEERYESFLAWIDDQLIEPEVAVK